MVEKNPIVNSQEKKGAGETENSYQFLFDENPALLFMINYERRIQDVNSKTCQFSGYSKSELIGADPLDYIHPSSRAKFSNIIDELFNKEDVTDTETDFITKDGRIRRILFSSGRLLKFHNTLSVLLSGVDVTERKKILEELQQNTELFTKFMNHLNAGIFIRDNKDNCIFRNRFILDNFDADIVKSISIEEKSSELSISKFLTLKDKRGKERYCEVTTFSFTSAKAFQFSGGIISDLTHRIEAERIKDSGEIDKKAVLHCLPDSIYIIDENGKILEYIFSNTAAPLLTRDMIVGFNIREILSPDYADELVSKIQQCLNTGEPDKIKYEMIINGISNYFESRIIRFENETVLTVNRNITEEKREEENYAEQLAELNSSKNKLLSIIAHDLRSPFHGLLGLTEILANEIQDLTAGEIKKIGKELHLAFKNQYRLLENLLAWSLIQNNKIEINIEVLNLSEAVDECINVLFWLANKKQITVQNLISSEVLIRFDPSLLSSILQNIITNAIKFSGEKSTVRVEYREKDGIKSVEIHDEGVGLSENEIEAVTRGGFTKPGTADEKGTGLGLMICREFIEKHGGRLYIESKKGSGTTVGFTIKN